jgi:hypothetical protein
LSLRNCRTSCSMASGLGMTDKEKSPEPCEATV